MAPSPRIPAESLLKKRERDRRAQQNARNKRTAQLTAFEERIATLESELQNARETCDGLQREVNVLRARQDSVKHLVASWNDGSDVSGGLPSPSSTVRPPSLGVTMLRGSLSPSAIIYDSVRGEREREDTKDGGQSASPGGGTSPEKSPGPILSTRWDLLPKHVVYRDTLDNSGLSSWLNKPDVARLSPETPRALDLLYGSKTNPLANAIYHTLQRWPTREAERLATGWLAYHILKWMMQPSEERFARLRDFQRPTLEQLQTPHRYFVDFTFWPQLRINMIKYHGVYDDHAVAGLLSCSIKVRWPWNLAFLEPDDNGEFVLKQDYYDAFTDLRGWGLTEEFFNRFPLLVEGLDPSVRYTFS